MELFATSTTDPVAVETLEAPQANTNAGARVLAFADIRYAVKTESEGKDVTTKEILHGVSGRVSGGTMMCCLGPSGSGKTSLIHIVSGHIKSTKNLSHQVEGQVTVDNQVMTTTQFQRISGLVTQEDVFNSSLTVGETLTFAAALKLKRESRQGRVEEVISSLQLDNCRNTYIGDDANPCKKRCAPPHTIALLARC